MEERINNRSIEKEQRKRLARAYFLEGLSIREIAQRLRMTETSIRNYLDYDEDEWLYVKHYYNSGLSKEEVARTLKIPLMIVKAAYRTLEKNKDEVSPSRESFRGINNRFGVTAPKYQQQRSH